MFIIAVHTMYAGVSRGRGKEGGLPPPGSLGCCPFKGGGYVVVDLLFMYFPLFVGVLCLSLFGMHYLMSSLQSS